MIKLYKTIVMLSLLTLVSCTQWNAVIAQRGANSSDQALEAALWSICKAIPVGAIKRRFKTESEQDAYNAICPEDELP